MVMIQKVLEVKQNRWCDFSIVGCAEQPADVDTIRAVLDKTASVKLPTTKVKLIIMWMEFVCYSRQKLHNFWRKCNSDIQSRRKLCISWHQSPDDLDFYKSYHIPIKYFCNAVSLHALERLLKSFFRFESKVWNRPILNFVFRDSHLWFPNVFEQLPLCSLLRQATLQDLLSFH